MRARSRLIASLRAWFRPGALDAEVTEELRFHLARQIDANLEAGMTPDEARRAAHVTVGSIDSAREQSRAGRPGAALRELARDLGFGVRLLRRSPIFAAISVLIVGLGVASTTSIFSVVYGVMLRPLPYDEPERLVALWSRLPNAALRARLNPADQRELLNSNTVFEDIALANAPQNFNLIGSGEPERVVAARLAANFFTVLRTTPQLGRVFSPADARPGNDVVLLSDGLWRRRFGADPAIVGRTINLSNTPYQVIGVMPPTFQFPEREHTLWIPLRFDPRVLTRQITDYGHYAVARLKPGVDLARAQREIDALAVGLEAAFPNTNRGVRIDVLPMLEQALIPIRPRLRIFVAAAFCLLLIAALNLAGLLATRATGRSTEFTVRLALGASRARLTLHAMAEVVPILVLGGALGVGTAWLAIDAFAPFAPPTLPRADGIAINGSVLAFSVVTLVLTGLVAGLLPALHAWRSSTLTTTSGSRAAAGPGGQRSTRSGLVVAQVALTLPLLVAAAGLGRGFWHMSRVEPGFTADNVLTMHLAIPRTKYPSDAEIARLYSSITDRVAAIPGVVSTAIVNRLPLSGNNMTFSVNFEGLGDTALSLQVRSVTPDYFSAMHIALREGRGLTEHDRAKSPFVGVIDERVANALWPGRSAIGQRFRITLPGTQPTWGEIVGVVANVRHVGLDSDEDRQLYVSYQQFTDGRVALVARTQTDPRTMAPVIQAAIRSIDPDQPVYDVRTMDAVVARSTEPQRLNLALIIAFAASSLLLAGVGLYGIIAFGVSERRREFGVRLALGAKPSDVCSLVLRRGLTLTGAGLAIGLVAAFFLTRGMESLLYNVKPFDGISLATAFVVLVTAALLASYFPARRAALIDPALTLRDGS